MTTILNVDDDEANRYSKSRTLRTADYDVIEAGSGAGALSLAAERLPDLVLLDIRLPDMSGLDVCQRLRNNPRTRQIPIIHISATYVTAKDEAKSLDSGADIYLAEPVRPTEMLAAIRTMLRLRSTELGLAAAEERMRLAADSAGIGTWEVDVHTGGAVWSKRCRQLLGLEVTAEESSLETWFSRIPPDDRARLQEKFNYAVTNSLPFEAEHVMVLPDNNERWISLFGKLHDGQRMIGVAMDITARKLAEQERERLLEQARSAQLAAEQAARTKDDFLATLSHELRTPMSAMLGWLHLLKTGKLTPDQQLAALETIERNAYLQNQLVNDMLDVSRIITGKMDLEMQALALETSVAAAVESAGTAAGARGIVLVSTLQPGTWVVNGSPERLQQVFNNLLGNAIKFSRRGSRVEISLVGTSDEVSVSVSDEGEGIAAEMLPHIFERFRQADGSTIRRHGGLGLGLSIVHSLVELHGGRVSASSAGLGKGAKFTVTLPLHREEIALTGRPPLVATSNDLTGIKVLAVDDDISNLEMVSKLLQFRGATVMSALDGFHALSIARTWRPDVLVLDIAMPEKDGYTLLGELRELSGGPPPIPAVALTGFASREDSERAIRAGFSAHVSKPCDMDALCSLLVRLVRQAKTDAGEAPAAA